jgi:hypothetical protein
MFLVDLTGLEPATLGVMLAALRFNPTLCQFELQAREDYTTMKKAKPTKPPSEEYSRFEQLVRQVITVPKSELDKREAAYQRDRKKDAKKKKAA